MRKLFLTTFGCLVFGFSLIANAQQEADLVLLHGEVFTVDEEQPRAEAVAVTNDRIAEVGSDDEVAKWVGETTEVIDLEGRLLVPGFIEGHGHFLSLGRSKMMLDLKDARSWQEIVEQVAEAAESIPAGQWIIGRGWHQEKWEQAPQPNVEGYPTREAIDEVTPSHPVLLTHASGHMSFANGYAMKLSGIDASTPNPDGGEILKDEDGKPIGVFRETAQGLINRQRSRAERNLTEAEQRAQTKRLIKLASEECIRKGITSFQDAGSPFSAIDALKQAAEAGELPLRLYVMIRDRNDLLAAQMSQYKMIGHANHFLTVRAVKRSIDGALGSHGAWLLLPYEDLPGSVGLNTASIDSVRRTAELCINNDFQLCVHAIGDRANREVLDIYEAMFDKYPTDNERRWRIEHAQHLHPEDIPRFAELNVIASMQGIHCTSDAVYVLQRLGQRRAAEGAYVWQKLIQSGAVVTNGTDAPVEDVDPIPCFYASVTRRLPDGSQFFPEQSMTREQALRSYTLNCAYAAFEEDIKGSITVGKLADMVVLSKNIMSCPEEEITDAQVDHTIIGGEVVYSRADEQTDDSD